MADAGALIVKRKVDDEPNAGAIIKKQKTDGALIPAGVKRTSNLQAPIMLLTGHKGEVFSMKFSPNGKHLASASFDKTVYLWNVYEDCKNYNVIRGHSSAVLDVHWSYDGSKILSSSADKTVMLWDAETGARVKKMHEHTSYVNACCPAVKGPPLVVSGSDDTTARVWDVRVRGSQQILKHKYAICTVAFTEHSTQVLTGGLDNDIRIWDLRKGEVVMKLAGHTDTITSLRLSPDGTHVLSNAMDNSVRMWDLRPFAPENRCVKTFFGVQHTFEKNLLKCAWSPDGSKISAGSGDRFVYVWDTNTRKITYKLPGHAGCVNEVDFHPNEPIIGSCSSDKNIFLGELEGS
eukprot:tig00000718_g3743.t1